MSDVRVATVAFPAGYDVSENLAAMIEQIELCADDGVDLVVFPETALQGYPPSLERQGFEQTLHHLMAVAEAVPDGPSVRAIADVAIRRGIHVIFGLTERGERPGVLHNTMVLTGPGGHIGRYRKVHVAVGERAFWIPGDEWPVFPTVLGRIGMVICYDMMWPEATRELVLQGADILVMSTAWATMPGHGEGEANLWFDQYRLFERTRAAENGRWFIGSNLAGNVGGFEFFGASAIIDPLGRVVGETPFGEASTLVRSLDVDGGIAAAAAANQGSFLIRDRRPSTYRTLGGESPVAILG